jgi:hypothetical protein
VSPSVSDHPQEPQTPAVLATGQILSHLTTFLQAYQDDPEDAGLYFAAPGLPGRHLAVHKLETDFGAALNPGFPRSCVTPEPPSSLDWLHRQGYQEHDGVWSRSSSLGLQEAAREILGIFQSAWGPAGIEAPTLLTSSRQVLEASRTLGQLALAPPGIPADGSPELPTPTQETLEIAFIGAWFFQGDHPDGTVCFLGPPTLSPENLELYVRLTFGTARPTSWYSLPQGGFYQAGWGFDASANPDLNHLFPDQNIHPDNSLVIDTYYYSWPDQSWIPLLFHPNIQLYSYPGNAQPIYSDRVTFLPPTFTVADQLFINPANPMRLSSKWAPFSTNGPFRTPNYQRPVEPYSLALQTPELLTGLETWRRRAQAIKAHQQSIRGDLDR